MFRRLGVESLRRLQSPEIAQPAQTKRPGGRLDAGARKSCGVRQENVAAGRRGKSALAGRTIRVKRRSQDGPFNSGSGTQGNENGRPREPPETPRMRGKPSHRLRQLQRQRAIPALRRKKRGAAAWETAAPRIPVAGERRPGGGCQIAARKLQGSKPRSVSFAEGEAVPLGHSIPFLAGLARPCPCLALLSHARGPRQPRCRSSRCAARTPNASGVNRSTARSRSALISGSSSILTRSRCVFASTIANAAGMGFALSAIVSSSPCASSGRRMPTIAPLPDARQTHVHLLAPAARRQ